MLDRARRQLTYGNVMATIALFVAVGGTSYAAITLPRNSVGHRQLKTGSVAGAELRRSAVTSRTIKNGTIETQDLAVATKLQLAGKPGPAGSQGPPALAFRASVTGSGTPTAGNVNGIRGVLPNKRLIGFSTPLYGCVPSATLARNSGDPGLGHIIVSLEADNRLVAVETFDSAGQPVYLPFNVVVAC